MDDPSKPPIRFRTFFLILLGLLVLAYLLALGVNNIIFSGKLKKPHIPDNSSWMEVLNNQ